MIFVRERLDAKSSRLGSVVSFRRGLCSVQFNRLQRADDIDHCMHIFPYNIKVFFVSLDYIKI